MHTPGHEPQAHDSFGFFWVTVVGVVGGFGVTRSARTLRRKMTKVARRRVTRRFERRQAERTNKMVFGLHYICVYAFLCLCIAFIMFILIHFPEHDEI